MLVSSAAPARPSSDEESLRNLLEEFLSRAGDVTMHESFWADDLVYTSSSGTRMGKQAILESMRDVAPDEEPAAPAYSADDVDIRVYGDTAVVAFRLVASGPAAEERSEYFNTGTFVRHEDTWRAVAWQATRIPPATGNSGD
jgi:ketosteroid isomerase-like protein